MSLHGTKDVTDYPDLSDREVLAKTIWGEARSDGYVGMHAVCCTILNRAKRPGWWGKNIREVCLKRRQYSCWNAGDPNLQKMINVTETDKEYVVALEIADIALDGKLEDITNHSTHYHTKSIMPYWARSEEPVAIIGAHMFYREP